MLPANDCQPPLPGAVLPEPLLRELAHVLAACELEDVESLRQVQALLDGLGRGMSRGRLGLDATILAQRLGEAEAERLRSLREQLCQLRGLHAASCDRLARVQVRLQQVAQALAEQAGRVEALRVVHARLARPLLAALHPRTLQQDLRRLREDCERHRFGPRAAQGFEAFEARLQERVADVLQGLEKIRTLLDAGFADLVHGAGPRRATPAVPALQALCGEVASLRCRHAGHFGLARLMQRLDPRFPQRFVRVLRASLAPACETAQAEVERWLEAPWAALQVQLDEQQQALQHRRDGVDRVQAATEDLADRIAELEAQELLLREAFTHARRLLGRVGEGVPLGRAA